MSASASSNFDIPMDVIHKILQLLRVKSLLRFKSVCKSWQDLINSTDFIKSHLKKSTEINSKNDSRLSFVPVYGHRKFDQYSLSQTDEHPQLSRTTRLYFPLFASQLILRLVGSCNGLLCFYSQTKLFALCNPSTRLFKPLPKTPIIDDAAIIYEVFDKCGFGYDYRSGDYKLVIVSGLKLAVYSLKTDSWKISEHNKIHLQGYSDQYGVLVNNRMHWSVRNTGDEQCRILSVDLYDEQAREVQLPEIQQIGTRIGVLDGCLCANFMLSNEYCEIWIMKKYCVFESWVKVHSLRSEIGAIPLRRLRDGNGNEVIYSDSIIGLFIWNSQLESISVIHNVPDVSVRHDMVEFIESLVPLEGDCYVLEGEDEEQTKYSGNFN